MGIYTGLYGYLKTNYLTLTLALIFLGGVTAGSAVVAWLDDTSLQRLLTLLSGFINGRMEQGDIATFFSALGSNLVLLTLLFILGFCAISAPLILLVPFFKGLGFGLSAGVIAAHYGISAAGYIGVLMLPNTVFSALVILSACQDALKLSRTFLNVLRPPQRGQQPYAPGRYCARFFMYVLLLCAGAALETYLYILFGSALSL
jgi:hypothetical protein